MTTTQLPDERERFGPYGGQYMPETLMTAVKASDRHCKALTGVSRHGIVRRGGE